MTLQEACAECIVNQSLKVAKALQADDILTKHLSSAVSQEAKNFSFSLTPPEVAADVYAMMARIAKKDDLYDEVKAYSTQKALAFVPQLKEKIQNSHDKLLTATKTAVAGNVIDLAAEVEFDLDEEIAKIFDTRFKHDDFEAFKLSLEKAKTLLVLGDNTGEHIFDALFIQTLQELYPDLRVSYMVRGCPIINDVTLQEAREAGFEAFCDLIDSGVDTPGFAYGRATKEAQELFDNVDIVVAKGMGNYECLTPSRRKNMVYLFKVKCSVVAASIGGGIGDIVCKVS
jgi:damage-control phosphatase, subfamily I